MEFFFINGENPEQEVMFDVDENAMDTSVRSVVKRALEEWGNGYCKKCQHEQCFERCDEYPDGIGIEHNWGGKTINPDQSLSDIGLVDGDLLFIYPRIHVC